MSEGTMGLEDMSKSLLFDLKALETSGPESLALMLNAISLAFVRAGQRDVAEYISRRATYTFATMAVRNG
jgi:hypothetical protein